MEDGVSRRTVWWLSGALLFSLVVAVVLFLELHRLSDRVDRERAYVMRTLVRDALLNRVLPDLPLPAARGDTAPLFRAGGAPHVVWLVDPDRCLQCLERLGEWRRVAQSGEVRAVAVLVGVGRSEAREIARETGLTGVVLYDRDGAVRRALPRGELPAMVTLGVDTTGRIRSVASRQVRGSCRWSPFEHALAAVQEPERLAPTAPATAGR